MADLPSELHAPPRPDDLVVARPEGLYCPPGDFYIDPWRPVERAVITHAHADHARCGHGHYLAHARRRRRAAHAAGRTSRCRPLRLRRGASSTTACASRSIRPGTSSGSAQVRLEHRRRGLGRLGRLQDRARSAPARRSSRCAATSSSPSRPSACRSTAGATQAALFADDQRLVARATRTAGPRVVLACYALGKAQRLLARLDADDRARSSCHGAVEPLNAGLPRRRASRCRRHAYAVDDAAPTRDCAGALVVAPPSAAGHALAAALRRLRATPSPRGWMQLRGTRRRRGVDRGFVLSDHADWPGLLAAIAATGAERVLVTHGYVAVLVRWLARARARRRRLRDRIRRGRGRRSAEPSPRPPTARPTP